MQEDPLTFRDVRLDIADFWTGAWSTQSPFNLFGKVLLILPMCLATIVFFVFGLGLLAITKRDV